MTTDRECLTSVQVQLNTIQQQITAQLGTTPPNPNPEPPPGGGGSPDSPNGYPNHGSLIPGASGSGGTQVYHNGPANFSYLIPDVKAHTQLELTAASGTHAVTFRAYDPHGALMKDKFGMPADYTFPSGAGGLIVRASEAGTYLLEASGGDEITTINHQRSPY